MGEESEVLLNGPAFQDVYLEQLYGPFLNRAAVFVSNCRSQLQLNSNDLGEAAVNLCAYNLLEFSVGIFEKFQAMICSVLGWLWSLEISSLL